MVLEFDTKPALEHYGFKLFGVIIFVQLVYWLLLAPISQIAPLEDFDKIANVEVAALSVPSFKSAKAVEHSDWKSEKIFWYACCDQEYFAFRYKIPLTEKPRRDLGLIAGFGADNHHIWVNGFPLLDRGKLDEPASYSKWTKGVLRVSQAMLQQGDNEILVITKRNNGGYTDLFPQTYGDYHKLKAATAKRSFFINDYRIATMIIIGFVGLLALVLVPISKNRAFAFWLAMLAGALSLRIAHVRWEDWPFSSQIYFIWYFFLTNMAALAWFNFVEAWSEKGLPWVRKAMLAIFCIAMLVIAIAIYRDQNPGFDLASTLTDLFLALSAITTAILFFWRLYRYPTPRYLEIGIFALGIVAMLMDGAGKFFSVWWSGSNLQYALPILLFGLVASVLGRNIRVYESMGAFNNELNRKLEKSKREIEDRYSELQQVQRARDIAEDRQRILRDMHDGIGSQLTGLLVEARADNLNSTTMQHGIESSLNDLRLVVDSLDNFGDNFLAAMASLHSRIKRQLDAAGIQLDWRFELDHDPGFNSQTVLQIARIIQEATTNIIRHSGANAARISIVEGSEGGDILSLYISDDGIFSGNIDDAPKGHGIKNIQHRVDNLNGELKLKKISSALHISIRMPMK